ncbi:MAG: hypothetical protein ACRBCI_12265 [Cellvibrionaceae bacterium]
MQQEKKSLSHLIDSVTEKLDALIAATLDKKITPKISSEITLWNTANIAEYLGVTHKYTSEYIVTHHTFPNAIRIPTKNGKKGHPRWYAGEVVEWVKKYKEK